MDLNKTQADLLAIANRRGILSVSRHVGRGQNGGKINEGHRDVAAALALEAAGLLVRVAYDRETETRRGRTVVTTHLTFRVPEKEG